MMTNESSLIFYIMFFLVITLFGLLYSKAKLKIVRILSLIAILIVLVLVVGFRINVGSDYSSYLRAIAIKDYGYYSPLSQAIFSFADNTLHSPEMVFVIYAMISALFLVLSLTKLRTKQSSIIPLFLIMYMSMSFPTTLNIMRQGLAENICLYAMLRAFECPDLIPFLIVILAALIHPSALVCLAALFLYKFSSTKTISRNIIIIMTALITTLLLSPAIAELPKVGYLMRPLATFSANRIQLLLLALYLPFTLFFSMAKKRSDSSLVSKLFALGMAAMALVSSTYTYYPIILLIVLFWNPSDEDYDYFYIGSMYIVGVMLDIFFLGNYASRISRYFTMLLALLAPTICNKLNVRNNKIILYTTLIVLAISEFVYCYYIRGDAHIFPYNNMLF